MKALIAILLVSVLLAACAKQAEPTIVLPSVPSVQPAEPVPQEPAPAAPAQKELDTPQPAPVQKELDTPQSAPAADDYSELGSADDDFSGIDEGLEALN